MLFFIVNHGQASKILHKAKEFGMSGGTIALAKGTIKNAFLNFLSLYDERKEIVFMGTNSKTADRVLPELDKIFNFAKPNHGIVFSTSTWGVLGTIHATKFLEAEEQRRDKAVYQLIMTIVNRGKAADVIDAASEAGSKGGTIINARGSGIHEQAKLFNMEIEPEKEMVLILAKTEVVDKITEAIAKKIDIEKPGNGIIFVQNVHRTIGLHE
ncbi:MAG: P-II family nitrogen regulator [Firmicutes bacterium]|nr:P-II family nitrogen regulator [Bacillota bacterium]